MIDVILPVLDEADAIPWVLDRLPDGYSPIVVDNGSSDGSSEVAGALGARIVHEPTRGFGAACYAGLVAATTPVVCFMDCDASLDPTDLPSVVAPVEAGAADLMIGARRAERGAWPLHARVANRHVARTVSRRFDVAITDIGPMRAARREALIALQLIDRRSGWPLEMLLRALRAGWRVHETPVRYRARTGRSKVTGTVRGTLEAVRDMRAQLQDRHG
ncbi:MAG TPA: glycosyltransferase family 2 protein [Acidimicrobiales bacterium]|nr:glycosyltransferase family 2 protein [Acidimicrobiales bacterium]